jgi:hypothetical protein
MPTLTVNQSLPRLCFNPKMVKMSAPELFPLTIVLNKHFIPAAITSLRGFIPAGSNSAISLKANNFHSLMTSH